MIRKLAERGIPPEKVAEAVEHALERPAAPARATWSGSTPSARPCARLLMPTRAFDRLVARAMRL